MTTLAIFTVMLPAFTRTVSALVGGGVFDVRGEVSQLPQIVTNLLINALNYTPTGTVRVTTSQTAAEACLQIEDTGMGIDPDDLPDIFNRCHRGRRSQRSETPGTGLGLAIVKEIIDLHEGRMEVTSQVKQGTTFKVWLPVFGENGDL
jgi:two-component system, OmpR family, phosphate regulon sensor histidine kinase PhoR